MWRAQSVRREDTVCFIVKLVSNACLSPFSTAGRDRCFNVRSVQVSRSLFEVELVERNDFATKIIKRNSETATTTTTTTTTATATTTTMTTTARVSYCEVTFEAWTAFTNGSRSRKSARLPECLRLRCTKWYKAGRSPKGVRAGSCSEPHSPAKWRLWMQTEESEDEEEDDGCNVLGHRCVIKCCCKVNNSRCWLTSLWSRSKRVKMVDTFFKTREKSWFRVDRALVKRLNMQKLANYWRQVSQVSNIGYRSKVDVNLRNNRKKKRKRKENGFGWFTFDTISNSKKFRIQNMVTFLLSPLVELFH